MVRGPSASCASRASTLLLIVAYTLGLLTGCLFWAVLGRIPSLQSLQSLTQPPLSSSPWPPTSHEESTSALSPPSLVTLIDSRNDRRKDVRSSFSALFSIPEDPTCTPGEPFEVTYVSFASVDREWMVPHLCKLWPGPMVIALYIHLNGTTATSALLDTPNLDELCPNLQLLQVHDASAVWDPSDFPINRLRNLAIRRVTSSHFLMVDIDLWPNGHMYHHLHQLARQQPQVFFTPRQALVVPAFEFNFTSKQERDSRSKAELVACMPVDRPALDTCLDQGHCKTFYSQFRHQTSTDFDRWRRQTPFELQHVPCFKSFRYEPYVLLRRCPPTPLYAEVFTGYGKNKVQYITHLRYLGFNFTVLPQSYVMHFPHQQSEAARAWSRQKGRHYQRMEGQYHLFHTWLDRFLQDERGEGEEGLTPLCPEAEQLNPVAKQRERRGSREVS